MTGEPAWLRRCWLAAAIVAPAVIYLEPIRSNFDFGQINVVLMTLVIADCVPRRTPWPRGMLLGVAIALKLTPAVFLLYFLLRRDTRALLVTAASAVVATLAGFAFAWRDSSEYWTETVRNTDRIGTATLNTNQNIAGALARLGLGEGERFVLWTLACFAVLGADGVGGATGARVPSAAGAGADLRGDVRPGGVAGVVVASLGVGAADGAGHRRRGLPAAARGARPSVTAAGIALMVWTPITLMPEHHETAASLWRQLAGGSYVWWALAVIVVGGTVSRAPGATRDPAVDAVSGVRAVRLAGGDLGMRPMVRRALSCPL